ncbi:hypothetical protein [Empedobacter brevis]|uniref:hypothetical protein n=1 Tax=Empedobacter brevis TaxID=247 RepID=UPI00132018EC|nr:hypothetical protein [Empedobacter brevis]QHC86415.1 hypothetical protein AS589_17315 [Empedobacter brevis]
METIKQILEKNNASIEELILCVEQIKEKGDVVIIKLDGGRNINHYTIMVMFSNNREMIRVDEKDLKTGLIEILKKYLE